MSILGIINTTTIPPDTGLETVPATQGGHITKPANTVMRTTSTTTTTTIRDNIPAHGPSVQTATPTTDGSDLGGSGKDTALPTDGYNQGENRNSSQIAHIQTLKITQRQPQRINLPTNFVVYFKSSITLNHFHIAFLREMFSSFADKQIKISSI